jgi:hypothetical protein
MKNILLGVLMMVPVMAFGIEHPPPTWQPNGPKKTLPNVRRLPPTWQSNGKPKKTLPNVHRLPPTWQPNAGDSK